MKGRRRDNREIGRLMGEGIQARRDRKILGLMSAWSQFQVANLTALEEG